MPYIPIADARPGQILAKPITQGNGPLLVRDGTILTEALIRRLGAIGIDRVAVTGDDDAKPTTEQASATLDRQFADHGANPLMMQLKHIVAAQAARRTRTRDAR